MARKRRKVLYIAVTRDEYELPLGVFDTPEELAKFLSMSVYSVSSGLARGNKGYAKTSVFFTKDEIEQNDIYFKTAERKKEKKCVK